MNDAFRLLASLLGLVFGSIGKLFSPLRAQIYSPIPQSHSPVGVPHPHRASAAAATLRPHAALPLRPPPAALLSTRRLPHFSPRRSDAHLPAARLAPPGA